MYGFSGKNQGKVRNTENVVKSKHFSQTFAGMLLKHLRGGDTLVMYFSELRIFVIWLSTSLAVFNGFLRFLKISLIFLSLKFVTNKQKGKLGIYRFPF